MLEHMRLACPHVMNRRKVHFLHAIIWSGIKEVHYCSTAQDADENGFSDMHIRDYLTGKDKSVLNVVKVDRREDCDNLFVHFHNKQK